MFDAIAAWLVAAWFVAGMYLVVQSLFRRPTLPAAGWTSRPPEDD
jgi:hypothetical protein